MKNSSKIIISHGEKFLLFFLILFSTFQFLQWGYQSIKYILSLFFKISSPETTFLSPIISIIALIGSLFLFIGSILRWKNISFSKPPLVLGFIFLLFQNIFDILNHILLTKEKYNTVTEQHIEKLTTLIGNELFQIIIWFLLLMYFLKKTKIATSSETTIPSQENK
ncbi:MAG: hypothetical protein EOM19_04130 [Candidatus Moranbacteria bacterium]|nr:hypothetical protein [Candidatus Moranbacteria bacterium]